jgi:hypothetical protein
MRCPSGDQPGVGGNARDTTRPSLTGADHYRADRRGVYRPAIAVLLAANSGSLADGPGPRAPFYIIVRSVEGLGGWSGRDLVSLYVMLGIGAAIMLYVRFRGQVGLLQHAEGDLPSPPPNQPWPPAGTQRRLDLSGHAQKHLSGYRHPFLNLPPASFVDRGPATWMLPSSRHRVASKPADSGAGQVGGETDRRGRHRPPRLTAEPVRLVRRAGRRRQAAPAVLPLLVMPGAEPPGPLR